MLHPCFAPGTLRNECGSEGIELVTIEKVACCSFHRLAVQCTNPAMLPKVTETEMGSGSIGKQARKEEIS